MAEFTTPVVPLTQVIAVVPAVKLTVPVGPIGVIVTPPTLAVKVTKPFTLDAPELVKVRVGLSWLRVCVVEALAGLAL
jgi:hypothetical protein